MINKSQRVSRYQLPLKIDPQKADGFTVSCPIWSDCYAQGDTIDEALLEITAVAQSLIELYKEEGLQIPLKLQEQNTVTELLSVPVIVAT